LVVRLLVGGDSELLINELTVELEFTNKEMKNTFIYNTCF
jgi:hypothetical protein